MFDFLMHIGFIFHLRSYPETTALIFATICSAFTSGNCKCFERRQVKLSQKHYGGKPRNKEMNGCSLNSQSISTVIIRLDRRFEMSKRSRLTSYVPFAFSLSNSER